MLQGFVEKIADLWNAPDQWIEAEREEVLPPEAPEPGPGDHFRRKFLDLARQRQRQNSKLVSSLLTVVWHGSKLAAYGSYYNNLRTLTGMVTDMVLEQMAAPPDFYLPYDTDNVVLCFASPNREVAELRTAMMAHALRAALQQRMPDLSARIRIEFVVSALEPVDVVARGTDLTASLVDLLCRARDSSAVAQASFARLGAPA